MSKDQHRQQVNEEKPAFTTYLLRDQYGAPSSMRVMSMIALFTAIVFGWQTISTSAENHNGIMITMGFLLAAFAPKALQKFAENQQK